MIALSSRVAVFVKELRRERGKGGRRERGRGREKGREEGERQKRREEGIERGKD